MIASVECVPYKPHGLATLQTTLIGNLVPTVDFLRVIQFMHGLIGALLQGNLTRHN
jgi:uncharacterized membrane protein